MSELKQLIEEYGGIQPPHLAFYMESIRFSSEAAMWKTALKIFH